MREFIKKFIKNSNLNTQIAVVVAIILVINFLSYQIFVRFDLTENKVYSISKISKNAVKNLDDLVNIKVYFSEKLPPQYITTRQDVKDILKEYENYANNKIKIEFIDPKENETLQQELQMLGIPQLQFNIYENDSFQTISGYLGVVVEYGDNKQAIPVIENTRNLEYQLTSSIKKVTAEDFPVIAFATGHEELDSASDTNLFKKKLEEIYEVTSVDLSTGDEIPVDISTLIIAGPKAQFNEREQYVIDQFIMTGKNILFLVDGIKINEQLQATKNNIGLDKLLAGYGIDLKQNLVLDTSNERASFNQGFMTFTTQYPFFVKINTDGFDQENAAVAKLQTLILPWTSEVAINDSKIGEAQINYLAKSTSQAWLMQDEFALAPQGDSGFYNDPEKYNLAISMMGKLNSAFTNYIAKEGETGDYISNTENAKIVVVGDSDFIKNNFIQRYPENLMFAQNLVDMVSLDSDLINIRSKDIVNRPLEEIEDNRKKSIKYFNIFGITIIVLAFGFFRYYSRKKSKFADEL